MSKRSLLPLLGLAVLAGYLAKLSTECREAAAVPPAACKKYDCKTVHAYWAGTPNVWGFFVPAAAPQVGGASSHAMQFIFTPASNEILPRNLSGNNVDAIAFTACVPMCGIDPTNGKWQSPQQVTPAGVVNPQNRNNNKAQRLCSVTNVAVNPSDNQSNDPNPGEPPIEPIATPISE